MQIASNKFEKVLISLNEFLPFFPRVKTFEINRFGDELISTIFLKSLRQDKFKMLRQIDTIKHHKTTENYSLLLTGYDLRILLIEEGKMRQ